MNVNITKITMFLVLIFSVFFIWISTVNAVTILSLDEAGGYNIKTGGNGVVRDNIIYYYIKPGESSPTLLMRWQSRVSLKALITNEKDSSNVEIKFVPIFNAVQGKQQEWELFVSNEDCPGYPFVEYPCTTSKLFITSDEGSETLNTVVGWNEIIIHVTAGVTTVEKILDISEMFEVIEDGERPVCNPKGTSGGAEFKIQDILSGIGNITVLDSVNASVNIPPFEKGDNDEKTVTATKTGGKSASVKLEITDVAGNKRSCDPIITLVIRERGKPVSETFIEIPQEESNLTVINGDPGLKNLIVTVNGEMYRITGLHDNEERFIDVSYAMVEGDNNTITLIAWGKPDTSATVVISD